MKHGLLLRSVRNSIALGPLTRAAPEWWNRAVIQFRFGRAEKPTSRSRLAPRGFDNMQEAADPGQHPIARDLSGSRRRFGNRGAIPVGYASGPTCRLEALTLEP